MRAAARAVTPGEAPRATGALLVRRRRLHPSRRQRFVAAVAGLAVVLSSGSAFAVADPDVHGLGSPATDGQETMRQAARPAWFDYDRPADYDSLTTSVSVPTRDGFELGCSLTRPSISGAPATGRFPGIVNDFTPYGLVENEPTDYSNYMARRGYAVLVCDIRGTGASPGPSYAYPSPGQADDGYDVVEWLAAQDFSSGEVGMSGTSYGGYTTMQVAALQPPHLTAVSPTVPPVDTYHEIFYPGGVPGDADWQWVRGPAVADAEFPERQLETFAAHPDYDDYWSSQSLAGTHGDVTVPVLIWGGWFDVFRSGEINHFRGMRAAGSEHTWAVMGPWVHGTSWEQEMEPIPLGAHLAWFDHWLRGDRSAPLPAAPLTSFEWSGTSGTWRHLDSWARAGDRRSLALTRTGGLRPGGAKSAILAHRIDPTDGPATTCLVGCPTPLDPRADNKAADRRRLTFTTDRLRRPQRVLGEVGVRLRLALPNADGNLVAKLMDVAPDGSVTEVAAGWMRASHRFGDDHQVPVRPGRFSRYWFRMQPTHWVFSRGHRLRISIMTGDAPRIASDESSGVFRLRVGARGSRVRVPMKALGR